MSACDSCWLVSSSRSQASAPVRKTDRRTSMSPSSRADSPLTSSRNTRAVVTKRLTSPPRHRRVEGSMPADQLCCSQLPMTAPKGTQQQNVILEQGARRHRTRCDDQTITEAGTLDHLANRDLK